MRVNPKSPADLSLNLEEKIDPGNVLFEKYRRRSFNSLQNEYDEHLKKRPKNYDPQKPYDHKDNIAFREWSKTKIELQEVLEVKGIDKNKFIYQPKTSTDTIITPKKRMDSYIKKYMEIIDKLQKIHKESEWMSVRTKGYKILGRIEKYAIKCCMPIPDLPKLPFKKDTLLNE